MERKNTLSTRTGKNAKDSVFITVSDRTSEVRQETEVEVALPISSMSALLSQIQEQIEEIENFEVWFKAKKEEHVLEESSFEMLATQINRRKVKKLYLFAPEEPSEGKHST